MYDMIVNHVWVVNSERLAGCLGFQFVRRIYAPGTLYVYVHQKGKSSRLILVKVSWLIISINDGTKGDTIIHSDFK